MAKDQSWLDGLLSGYTTVTAAGNPVTQRKTLNLLGVTVADNPTTGATDVAVAGSLGTFFATLATITATADHQTQFLDGYASKGDGGGGWFSWNTTSMAAEDHGTVKAGPLGAGVAGRWIRDAAALGVGYNVCWFGADRTGVVDSLAAINFAKAAASASASGGHILLFPSGTFLVSGGFFTTTANNGLTIVGCGAAAGTGGALPHTKIKLTANATYLFQLSGIRIRIEDLWLHGNHHASQVVHIEPIASTCEFERCVITHAVSGTGTLVDLTHQGDVDNMLFKHCLIAQDPDGDFNVNTAITSVTGSGGALTINSTAPVAVNEVVSITGNSLITPGHLFKVQSVNPGVSFTINLTGTGTVSGGTVTQLDWSFYGVNINGSNIFITTFYACIFNGAYRTVAMTGGSANFHLTQLYLARDSVFQFEVCQPFVVDACYSEQLAGVPWVVEPNTAGVNVTGVCTFKNNQVNTNSPLNFVCKQPIRLEDNYFGGNVNVNPVATYGLMPLYSDHTSFAFGANFAGSGYPQMVREIETIVVTNQAQPQTVARVNSAGSIAIPIGTAASYLSTNWVNSGFTMLRVKVTITTPYSVGATIQIGQPFQHNYFQDSTAGDINPQAVNTYTKEIALPTAQGVVGVYIGGSPGAGAGNVVFEWDVPLN